MKGIFKTVVFFSTLLFLQACKKDPLDVATSPASDSKENFSIVQVPFKDVKDELANINAGSLNYLLQSNLKFESISVKDESTSSSVFVYTDSVKKVVNNGVASYVFAIRPTTPRSRSFQNITVVVDGSNVKAYLTTYVPTLEWSKKWKELKGNDFKGTITLQLLDIRSFPNKKFNSTPVVKLQTVCETIPITVTSAYGCSQGGHMPGDPSCAWEMGGDVPAGEHKAGYNYTTYLVTSCQSYDVGGDQGGGGGGGGSGGGGSTPFPPGDYDPCDVVPTGSSMHTISGVPPSCDDDGSGDPPPLPTVPDIFPLEIKYNGLSDFECVRTAIQNLENNAIYQTFIAPFRTVSMKPDLVWGHNDNLPWHELVSSNPPTFSTTYGINIPRIDFPGGGWSNSSSTIQLNTDMLRYSSRRLILTTAIHETLHAYFNYIQSWHADWQEIADDNKSVFERLNVYSKYVSTTNGQHHLATMKDFLVQISDIVKEADNSTATEEHYMKLIIGGLLVDGKLPAMATVVFNLEIDQIIAHVNSECGYNITRQNAREAVEAERVVSENNRLSFPGCAD